MCLALSNACGLPPLTLVRLDHRASAHLREMAAAAAFESFADTTRGGLCGYAGSSTNQPAYRRLGETARLTLELLLAHYGTWMPAGAFARAGGVRTLSAQTIDVRIRRLRGRLLPERLAKQCLQRRTFDQVKDGESTKVPSWQLDLSPLENSGRSYCYLLPVEALLPARLDAVPEWELGPTSHMIPAPSTGAPDAAMGTAASALKLNCTAAFIVSRWAEDAVLAELRIANASELPIATDSLTVQLEGQGRAFAAFPFHSGHVDPLQEVWEYTATRSDARWLSASPRMLRDTTPLSVDPAVNPWGFDKNPFRLRLAAGERDAGWVWFTIWDVEIPQGEVARWSAGVDAVVKAVDDLGREATTVARARLRTRQIVADTDPVQGSG